MNVVLVYLPFSFVIHININEPIDKFIAQYLDLFDIIDIVIMMMNIHCLQLPR